VFGISEEDGSSRNPVDGQRMDGRRKNKTARQERRNIVA